MGGNPCTVCTIFSELFSNNWWKFLKFELSKRVSCDINFHDLKKKMPPKKMKKIKDMDSSGGQ